MKPRRITLPIVLFAAAYAHSGAAHAGEVHTPNPTHADQFDARIPALRRAEAARFKANIDADAKVLDQVLDDELEYVHSNGEVNTKAEFIESLTSGKRRYLTTTYEIQNVRVMGVFGIVRGTAKVTVADNGQSRDLDIGYTSFWLYKDARWQMTEWRSARMPPAAPKK